MRWHGQRAIHNNFTNKDPSHFSWAKWKTGVSHGFHSQEWTFSLNFHTNMDEKSSNWSKNGNWETSYAKEVWYNRKLQINYWEYLLVRWFCQQLFSPLNYFKCFFLLDNLCPQTTKLYSQITHALQSLDIHHHQFFKPFKGLQKGLL